MPDQQHAPLPDRFERSARSDLRNWGMLAVGVGLAVAGWIVDPATNCDSADNCAPWLMPIAFAMGAVFMALGLGQLLANPRRGYCFDPASGDLVWWQNRVRHDPGDTGRIHPAQIGRIMIASDSDGDDWVNLYDIAGERQYYFDAEVIPWPQADWARKLGAALPHITVDIRR